MWETDLVVIRGRADARHGATFLPTKLQLLPPASGKASRSVAAVWKLYTTPCHPGLSALLSVPQ